MLNTVNKFGSIFVEKEALKVNIRRAVSDVYGVWGFAAKRNSGAKRQIRRLMRGVRVKADGGFLSVKVDIVIKVGISTEAVVASVESAIRFVVESHLGFALKNVKVRVVGYKL